MLWAAEFSPRQWYEVEWEINRAAHNAKKSGVKDWFQFINPDDVCMALKTGEVEACIVEGYLIVFQVGGSWYNKDVVFVEELLVLSLSPNPGNFRVVPRALLEIAEGIPHCAGVCVGTALTQDERLSRVYQRFGFKTEAQSLFRSI